MFWLDLNFLAGKCTVGAVQFDFFIGKCTAGAVLQMKIIRAVGVTAAPTNHFSSRLYNCICTSRLYKSIYRGGLGTAPTNP